MNNEKEIAWAAGLFDGEGTIYTYSPSNRPKMIKLQLAIQMTEFHPIERFAKLFGLKIRKNRPYGVSKLPTYQINAYSEEKVIQIFETIKPFLSKHKIKQGEEAIAKRKNYVANSSWHNKEYCKHGHKMTKKNTTKDKRGYVSCKECRRIAARRYRTKKKGGVAWP